MKGCSENKAVDEEADAWYKQEDDWYKQEDDVACAGTEALDADRVWGKATDTTWC